MRGGFDISERGQRYQRKVLDVRERFDIKGKGLTYESKVGQMRERSYR